MDKSELIRKLTDDGIGRKIISAFELVRREDFVPDEYKDHAYEDIALPIGYGQTISQPSTIAFMLTLLDLESDMKVMEVGSGSGYAIALLSALLDGEVYGVELMMDLVKRSKKVLKRYSNINISLAGKTLGLPQHAPFDRILVSAAAERIPNDLVDQLCIGGVMVCPIKDSIVKVRKGGRGITQEVFPGYIFVPLMEQ